VRTSLESLAAYRAAQHLEDASAREIREAAGRMKQVTDSSFAEWAGREISFHRTVWTAARSDLLFKQLNQLIVFCFSLSTIRFFKPTFGFDHVVEGIPSWETAEDDQGHQKVSEAILTGNPEVAREHMILHIMGNPCVWDLRKRYFGI
jgi:DNA-binding GntR family transcriptional regulator